MPKKIDLTPEPKTQEPVNSQLLAVAKRISADAAEKLENDEIDPIEAAGHQSLATLLKMYSTGDLPPDFAAGLLKSIAEKKTPNPVQKIEQVHKVDLNVVFSRLVSSSPDTLARMTSLANERASQVRLKLGVGNDYSLPIADADNEAMTLQSKAPEPDEISDIRSGGDGSSRRNPIPIPENSQTNSPTHSLYNAPAGKSFLDSSESKAGNQRLPDADKYNNEEVEQCQ